MSTLQRIARHMMFDGHHERYSHQSQSTTTEMTFAIYLPPCVEQGQKVPVLYFLSGLTCNDENFSTKACAQRYAAEHGVALVMPDTSPRGESVANDEGYDLGQGAGFYVDATQAPWHEHYRMYSYIVQELPALIEANFPVTEQRSIFGHSMGGHGALMIALRNATRYAAVSAFAPIVNPSQTPWGQKAFSAYLGDDRQTWSEYDSCQLLEHTERKLPIMIDQGESDNFYPEQLRPETFVEHAQQAGFDVRFRMLPGYDHSYFFIASFVEEHIRFHVQALRSQA